MAGSIKVARLQELIRLKVSSVIHRDLSDPRIGLITITQVKLSNDLSTAKIYFSVLGTETARSKCIHALDHGRGFIQREVASVLKTRKTPAISFHYDDSIETSIRISQKLREVLPPESAVAAGDTPTENDSEESDSGPNETR